MASKAYKEDVCNRLLRKYYDSYERVHVRLGQWFVNHYCSSSWPELFYEENDRVAIDKIYMWLLDNGYTKRMPKEVSSG